MNNSIYPCLWFDGQARAAADFYCAVFNQGKITTDTPMVVTFELSGQKFMCLNGGPVFKPNASVSFFVVCETEEETNMAWQKLTDGGTVMMALDHYDWSKKYGWVQDKFGVNWQLSLGKMEDVGQKYTPTLMFTGPQHGKARQAIGFYTSLFSNSSVAGILTYSADDDDVEGTVKHAMFPLNNYVMMAMDSTGPHAFTFSEGISIVVECQTQQEIDHYWNSLTEGGEESMCGWVKDPFGVSWQIIPASLSRLMTDPARAQRVMQRLMQMKKLDIEALESA